jgi:plastocyanin
VIRLPVGNDHICMTRTPMLAALLGAALLAGCGGDDDAARRTTTTAPAATDRIRIADFLFEPDPATVRAGRPIAVVNADSAPHTLTQEGGSPSFDSGTIKGSKRGSVIFPEAGTYRYFCEFHATMKGTVTVVE